MFTLAPPSFSRPYIHDNTFTSTLQNFIGIHYVEPECCSFIAKKGVKFYCFGQSYISSALFSHWLENVLVWTYVIITGSSREPEHFNSFTS